MRTHVLGVVVIVLLALPDSVYCQSSKAREQSSFALEEPMQYPVPLPAPVLEKLRAETQDRKCPTSDAHGAVNASAFSASEVTLKQGELPGLVVKAEGGCLLGANIGPFWVFRHMPEGYELVLNQSALDLKLLQSATKGYRDLELCATVQHGESVVCLKYKFKRGKYELSGRRTTRN